MLIKIKILIKSYNLRTIFLFRTYAMNRFTSETVKKTLCPYQEKCYRKNPIHFNEMSHPHLEKLIINNLDDVITIPAHLDFECPDRSQLLDQLKVLQIVLKKERDRNGGTSQSLKPQESINPKNSPKNSNSKGKETISDELKQKIERNKQAALLRREKKLKELDEKAELLASYESGSFKNIEKSPKQNLKRNGSENNDKTTIQKKSKTIEIYDSNFSSQSSSSSNTNSYSSDSSATTGTSIVENFIGCKTTAARENIRKQALEKMRRAGLKANVVEPGEFALKYALSAPYHLFFTRVEEIKETFNQPLTITLPEILDISLGEIVESLHFNFMIDMGWLCLQYLLAAQSAKMLVLYESRVDSDPLPANITAIEIPKPSAFGCHHTKVSLLKYKDNGIRIIVSTANLYSDDWENRTQGVWISPHLPQLPESSNSNDGESPTGFKKDFERYLLTYKQATLTEWIYAIRHADCSAINVFFLASVPGSHKGHDLNNWGHKKLASILSQHATLPADSPYWPIVAQCSSIGSFGPNFENWLQKDIVTSMSKEKNAGLKSITNFQFVYPSINNFKNSIDCRAAACCLPYSMKTHSKQEWIESYMYQWKASKINRDRAMPHIKSYTRISRDFKKIPWFVLTSANLSKAAWGTFRQSNYIMNYEAGIVFIPKLITKETTFPIEKQESSDIPVFPMPYDLPLTRYGPQDKAFVIEFFDSA
ncbi:probable tyrosyl-DNA phosphodiesterase [Leptopilina boulardi]|uniref:probable tyrosyl-DNA phosphodiesterase n=1 Tax=Leptopilina boulardi TaxID=63433 RepID=UPI0021F5A911|nr:probable tyrosyl-DNA phosphodiesterase [Leptopilina boulardi]